MSYVRESQVEAFQGSKLEKLDGGSEILLFKVTPPNRFHWCYVMFTPLGIIIGGDQRFGDTNHGTAVCSGYGLDTFLKADEDYLGGKFFGRKPTGAIALARWTNDVGWLIALQQEFKRLYGAMHATSTTQ